MLLAVISFNPLQVQTKLSFLRQFSSLIVRFQSPIGTNKTQQQIENPINVEEVSIPYRYKQNILVFQLNIRIEEGSQSPIGTNKTIQPKHAFRRCNKSQSPIGTNKTLCLILLKEYLLVSQSPIGTNKTLLKLFLAKTFASCLNPLQVQTKQIQMALLYVLLVGLNPLQVQTKLSINSCNISSNFPSQSPIGTNKT